MDINQMPFKEDIINRIHTDFGDRANSATLMLVEAIKKVDYLKTDRVIRCILFLANGNMSDLNKFIESATYDTRDVMFWAEYVELPGNFNFKRLRDFNKTFEECANDVKE